METRNKYGARLRVEVEPYEIGRRRVQLVQTLALSQG